MNTFKVNISFEAWNRIDPNEEEGVEVTAGEEMIAEYVKGKYVYFRVPNLYPHKPLMAHIDTVSFCCSRIED